MAENLIEIRLVSDLEFMGSNFQILEENLLIPEVKDIGGLWIEVRSYLLSELRVQATYELERCFCLRVDLYNPLINQVFDHIRVSNHSFDCVHVQKLGDVSLQP